MPYADTWGKKAKARSKNRTEYFRTYRNKRDAKKIRARKAVEAALSKGILKRLPCERYGIKCRGRIEAHHDDYEKPLKVRWLCSWHHRERHSEIAPKSNKRCLNCKKQISFPKKKYCSDRCNLNGWRKGL